MPPFNPAAFIRALLIWLVIMATESVHGALRRLLFSAELNLAIRQISVAVGVVIIFVITWIFLEWIRIRTARGALGIGLLWAGLTLVFELALGRLTGMGWHEILADYDLSRGGLMPLGLVAMALTPWAVRQMRGARKMPHPPHPARRSAP